MPVRSVYVATACRGRTKVGLSGDPTRRVRELAGASGYRVVLADAHPTADAEAVERMAHWLLRAARLHGEWFSVNAETAKAAVSEALARIATGERAPWRVAGSGRPSLGIISTTVRLPRAVLERIDALIGPNRRAAFIREAVEEKLAHDPSGAVKPITQPKPQPKAAAAPQPKPAPSGIQVGPVTPAPGSRLKKVKP